MPTLLGNETGSFPASFQTREYKRKDQHDEIIAIEKSIYLIAIFIYTLSKSLNHHHTEQTSEALVEDE